MNILYVTTDGLWTDECQEPTRNAISNVEKFKFCCIQTTDGIVLLLFEKRVAHVFIAKAFIRQNGLLKRNFLCAGVIEKQRAVTFDSPTCLAFFRHQKPKENEEAILRDIRQTLKDNGLLKNADS